MSGNQERAGLRAAHVVRSAWIGGFNMGKIPDSEYIAHLQGLDVEGKIKYLLDQDKLHTKAIDKLIKQEQAHYEAHQAVMEAEECRKKR